jgi:hypothetical protein
MTEPPRGSGHVRAVADLGWETASSGTRTIVRLSGAALTGGTEEHDVDGVRIRITSPARTVVDCFLRNRIGIDVAVGARTGDAM